MVNIGELWQLQAQFYLAKVLKFRGLTSGLNKLKIKAGWQDSDPVGSQVKAEA